MTASFNFVYLSVAIVIATPAYAIDEPKPSGVIEVSQLPTSQATNPQVTPNEALPDVEQIDNILPEPIIKILDTADAPRDYLSEKIVSFSQRIDQFFGDPRYFQENNKSVLQLELNQTYTQGGEQQFLFEGKAKIDLPAAQRRFQLVLESNSEQKTTGEVKKDQSATTTRTKPEQYTAALRFEKSEAGVWHFSSDAGAQFQFPLDPFVRVRGSYAVPLGDWRWKTAETVFWFSVIGLGETTQIDFERVLSAPFLFRATTTATCFEAPQNCDLRQDFSIFHTLNDRTGLLYQASVIGVSQPELEETSYSLLMRYRYRLHKDWIFFETTPQFNFPRTDGFKVNASILFRLEVLFGAKQ